MNTIKQLCQPRESIFDQSRRDVVLDLTDLIENRINPAEFFTENYLTGGMRHKAVMEVARAYAQALRDARQMDITNVSPDKFIQQIRES